MVGAKKMMPEIVTLDSFPGYARKSARNVETESKCCPKSSSKNRLCKDWVLSTVGVSFLVVALLMIVFDPLEKLVRMAVFFGPDTYIFDMWREPPIKVNLNFYIFNYTNAEAFLRGDEKLSMHQIGPYSYQEFTKNQNITFNNNNTISYIPVRSAVEDPDRTVGDPMTDIVVVPNFAFLGLASYLSESSFFTNMAFNVFTRMVNSQPFLTLTVDEYLRGYDEPLLSYANKLVPGMVTFNKMGYLDRMLSEGENVVTVRLNDQTEVLPDGEVYEPFSVDLFNGGRGLKEWGYDAHNNDTHKVCNALHGVATEGVLIPRKLHESSLILLYRKAFCRILPIVYDRPGKTSLGVPGFWLKFPEDTFHNSNPDNSCYCNLEEGDCLPDGLTDIGPCLFDMPVALSAPHFLYGDPKLLEPWDALSPNAEDHGSAGLVDNKFGVIVHAHLRMQLNLIVRKTKYNTVVEPFNNMVLPAVWIEYQFNHLPNFYHAALFIAAVVVPILHSVTIAAAIFIGSAIVLRSIVNFLSARTEYRRLKRANTTTSNSSDMGSVKTYSM